MPDKHERVASRIIELMMSPEVSKTLTLPRDIARILREEYEGMGNDTARLDWWDDHLNYEHGVDYEEGSVVLYEVSGNVNDRVWTERACAETLRGALDGAIRYQQGRERDERMGGRDYIPEEASGELLEPKGDRD